MNYLNVQKQMQLTTDIKNCTKCGLYKLMPTGCKPVPGIGPLTATIMVVPEALGKDESILEEPLVGQCGQLFNKIIKEAGLNREDLFIANVVRCRPTETGAKNRPPSKDEINACKGWLFEEITVVKPRIIVAMGKVAVSTLIPGLKKTFALGPMCGQLYTVDYTSAKIVPMMHPSWLLQYGKNELQKTIDEFKMVKVLSETK